MNYDDYSSQDRKILTWDKKNYEGFIGSFSLNELDEMAWYLANHPYHPVICDYSYNDSEDRSGLLYDYIGHWLYELINDGAILGAEDARTLFEILISLC